MSYRLIDANALNGVISNDDYEKVLNAPCIFADLPKGLDGEHYNLQEPVIDKIRAEIDGIEITGQINEHTSFIRTGDSVKKIVLEILDKYR
jgi:hypothetical protein